MYIVVPSPHHNMQGRGLWSCMEGRVESVHRQRADQSYFAGIRMLLLQHLMLGAEKLVGSVYICVSAVLVPTLLTPHWHHTFPSAS